MSVFKPFITSDVIVSPFEVNKTFVYSTANFTDLDVGIERYYGTNVTESLWSSGSNPTGQNYIQDTILVYHSIRELYYSNFLSGSNGSPANTASFNVDGTITGQYYTPSYYNYLSNTLPSNRVFPTGSGEQIGVISIPSNLFGEYLKPGSLVLSSSYGTILLDDANGNLISGSVDANGNYVLSNYKYGDVIYEHGMVIITNQFIGSGVALYGTGSYGSSTYGGPVIDLIDLFINTDKKKVIWPTFLIAKGITTTGDLRVTDTSTNGSNPDPNGNKIPNENLRTIIGIGLVPPPVPEVISAVYKVDDKRNPKNIGHLIKKIPIGTIPTWCNVDGTGCTINPPILPNIVGTYIWCVKSLDTITGLTSTPCVYDTVRIIPINKYNPEYIL
jgi:hypothetical protein